MAAAVLLASLAAPARSEPEPPDPRIAEADSLLGDAQAFPRAIALYLAVLEDAPDDGVVRLKLARVLSWHRDYDDSISEYDRLIEGAAPPRTARVEKGEVLSWAARYAEAEQVFLALLEEHPRDARAARGLARVYAWSGRPAQANEAYERALELEEDPEARREWQALLDGYRPTVASRVDRFGDSDGYDRLDTQVLATIALHMNTRLVPRLGLIRVTSDHPLASDDRGYELAAALRRNFAERLEGEIEVGGRIWENAPSRPTAGMKLSYTTVGGTALGFTVEHGDALDATDSPAALTAGLVDTSLRLTAWRGFGEHFETFAAAGAGWLSDANTRHRAEATLSWRPWVEHGFRAHLSGGTYGYAHDSPLYYDPETDLQARLGFTQRSELPGHLTLELEAGGGVGYARQKGLSAFGPSYDVAGSLSWVRGPLKLALRGSHSRSQRAVAYISNRFGVDVGVEF
jgi:tetratricopeptide (TPR) repeat protein